MLRKHSGDHVVVPVSKCNHSVKHPAVSMGIKVPVKKKKVIMYDALVARDLAFPTWAVKSRSAHFCPMAFPACTWPWAPGVFRT